MIRLNQKLSQTYIVTLPYVAAKIHIVTLGIIKIQLNKEIFIYLPTPSFGRNAKTYEKH